MSERIAMSFRRMFIWGFALLPVATGLAARAEGPPAHCVRISMIDDGKPIDPPRTLTFADGSEREEVEAHESRYCVPDSMMGASTLDLTFETAGSRFNLFHVRMDVLDADWELAFGGKRYARDEHLAKTINAEESCTLHIHSAEEDKSLTLKGCRLQLRHTQ